MAGSGQFYFQEKILFFSIGLTYRKITVRKTDQKITVQKTD